MADRLEIVECVPVQSSWQDRVDLVRIAHATTNQAVRRHALRLLDEEASSKVVSIHKNDALPPAGWRPPIWGGAQP